MVIRHLDILLTVMMSDTHGAQVTDQTQYHQGLLLNLLTQRKEGGGEGLQSLGKHPSLAEVHPGKLDKRVRVHITGQLLKRGRGLEGVALDL